MNHDHPADPRQHPLTGALRCYYNDPRHRKLRPDCDGVAVVAYGPTTLCAHCDLRRSTVGKGTTVMQSWPTTRMLRTAATTCTSQRTGPPT